MRRERSTRNAPVILLGCGQQFERLVFHQGLFEGADEGISLRVVAA